MSMCLFHSLQTLCLSPTIHALTVVWWSSDWAREYAVSLQASDSEQEEEEEEEKQGIEGKVQQKKTPSIPTPPPPSAGSGSAPALSGLLDALNRRFGASATDTSAMNASNTSSSDALNRPSSSASDLVAHSSSLGSSVIKPWNVLSQQLLQHTQQNMRQYTHTHTFHCLCCVFNAAYCMLWLCWCGVQIKRRTLTCAERRTRGVRAVFSQSHCVYAVWIARYCAAVAVTVSVAVAVRCVASHRSFTSLIVMSCVRHQSSHQCSMWLSFSLSLLLFHDTQFLC
jgi:hypothetical protein